MGSRPASEELRGVHVLVVDDDDEARTLLHSVLDYFGAEVHAVDSARSALMVATHITPQVVVSDIVMPGDDGFALLRALKTRRALRDVPVIALTAYTAVHAAEDALSAGFSAYLSKPVEPWELCRTIGRVRRGGRV